MPSTFYEHDDAGRLVRSWTEPEWDEKQTAWMLALSEYRASRCPCGCGHAARDTLSSEETGPTFTAKMSGRCRARDALLMAQGMFKNPRPEAMLWHTEMGGRKR